ncbi:hypothetical protein [Yinghuangia seranimata]|uniref:hypothetical protein n=1 Tax=Yinghuangia seranimata TaxID=408067 RepID=UPI00248B8A99|nr:hypothetical protein [Yinghuangia seranimata]MDI2127642.1 hypothetical protein [Yinghuangia seranimata]
MNTKAPHTSTHHLGEDVDHAGHVDTGIMSRRWIYIGSVVLLVGLLIGGILAYRDVRQTNEATDKANELRETLTAAGLPAPSTDTITRTLGTDGGPVCEDPGKALHNGVDRVGLDNGAAGPGLRPVIGTARIAQAERIVLQTYCPDKVDDFDDELGDLTFDDVVKP